MPATSESRSASDHGSVTRALGAEKAHGSQDDEDDSAIVRPNKTEDVGEERLPEDIVL